MVRIFEWNLSCVHMNLLWLIFSFEGRRNRVGIAHVLPTWIAQMTRICDSILETAETILLVDALYYYTVIKFSQLEDLLAIYRYAFNYT